MKFNFKKVASVLASAVMITSTVGFAAASNYPAPFTSGAAVVYGTAGQATDMAAAISISNNLNGKVTTSTGTTATASGGDSINLGTSSRKVYFKDSLNVARSSLSSSDMPSVLGDGKVIDLKGTEYSYTQIILPGQTSTAFDKSSGDLTDPALYINTGTTATSPIYNYTLRFNKNINVSDDTNVQGQKVKILGVDYVIGSGSTNSTLFLYGSGETLAMVGGDSKTVTIGAKEHTVDFVGATSTTAGKISVDGVSKTVTKGSSYSFAGDINVYVKDVTYQSYAGGLQSIDLIVGANTLKLVNGETVKKGADVTSIEGTNVVIVPAGTGVISGFTVQIAASSSETDYILAGKSFNDPVFGGLSVQFAGSVPDLADKARANIRVDTDNNQYGYVTFTSAQSGETGEKKLTFIYDNNTASSTVQPLLASGTIDTSLGNFRIHVLEGENALKNDAIVINQGDSGAILKVSSFSNDSTNNICKVIFTDLITGKALSEISLPKASSAYTSSGLNLVGGTGYTVSADGACTSTSSVNITWSAGGVRSVFPRIKLKDGGWLALMTSTTVTNATSLLFPDSQSTLTTSGDAGRASRSVEEGGSKLNQNINWTYTVADTNTTTIFGISNIASGGGGCNFNVTNGPAILYLEPKKNNDTTTGSFICVQSGNTGGTAPEVYQSKPSFGSLNSANSGFITYGSDTYKTAALDNYGALATYESRTNENGVSLINTPASQMYLDILFTSVGTTITPGTSGGTAGSAVSIITDKEVSSYATSNLIIVGGSCVNEAAAKILGSEIPLCGADFTAKTKVSAGGYIIKTVASPYADTGSGKVAMLVAGYEAAETTTAAKAVLDGVDTTVDKETIYPVVTA